MSKLIFYICIKFPIIDKQKMYLFLKQNIRSPECTMISYLEILYCCVMWVCKYGSYVVDQKVWDRTNHKQ